MLGCLSKGFVAACGTDSESIDGRGVFYQAAAHKLRLTMWLFLDFRPTSSVLWHYSYGGIRERGNHE
jgi:hypothetical protein